MKIENTVKIFKEIHPNDIILVKNGMFYHVYGRDAYILAYLFDYQIKKVQINYSTCGFSASAINKVMTKLEQLSINYMVVDKSENYEVIDKENFKLNNRYIPVFNKAHSFVSKKNRIDNIRQFLMETLLDEKTDEKIIRIEEVIYETR